MKQLLGYLLCIALWAAGAILWAARGFAWLLMALLVLHAAELALIGWRTGRKYGLGAAHILAMCLLFGIVWWKPLHNSIEGGRSD